VEVGFRVGMGAEVELNLALPEMGLEVEVHSGHQSIRRQMILSSDEYNYATGLTRTRKQELTAKWPRVVYSVSHLFSTIYRTWTFRTFSTLSGSKVSRSKA
jgi:hypothetical protein